MLVSSTTAARNRVSTSSGSAFPLPNRNVAIKRPSCGVTLAKRVFTVLLHHELYFKVNTAGTRKVAAPGLGLVLWLLAAGFDCKSAPRRQRAARANTARYCRRATPANGHAGRPARAGQARSAGPWQARARAGTPAFAPLALSSKSRGRVIAGGFIQTSALTY
jgi:hypothetical protein